MFLFLSCKQSISSRPAFVCLSVCPQAPAGKGSLLHLKSRLYWTLLNGAVWKQLVQSFFYLFCFLFFLKCRYTLNVNKAQKTLTLLKTYELKYLEVHRNCQTSSFQMFLSWMSVAVADSVGKQTRGSRRPFTKFPFKALAYDKWNMLFRFLFFILWISFVRSSWLAVSIFFEKTAYYWMDPVWSFRRTSIRRLAQHYQLIWPVIRPAVRKRSKLTPVWKQSDNANSANEATSRLHLCVVCVCLCAHMWTEASLHRLWLCELSDGSGWLGVEGSTSGGNLLYNSVYYCCGQCLRSTHTITVHSARLQVASGLN